MCEVVKRFAGEGTQGLGTSSSRSIDRLGRSAVRSLMLNLDRRDWISWILRARGSARGRGQHSSDKDTPTTYHAKHPAVKDLGPRSREHVYRFPFQNIPLNETLCDLASFTPGWRVSRPDSTPCAARTHQLSHHARRVDGPTSADSFPRFVQHRASLNPAATPLQHQEQNVEQ